MRLMFSFSASFILFMLLLVDLLWCLCVVFGCRIVIANKNMFFLFFDASSHLYKRPCPSVGWSVGWSVTVSSISMKNELLRTNDFYILPGNIFVFVFIWSTIDSFCIHPNSSFLGYFHQSHTLSCLHIQLESVAEIRNLSICQCQKAQERPEAS